jgi:predicted RNase H-like HicB family nuclease
MKPANRSSPLKVSRKAEMEKTVKIHIRKLPEGVYLATSEDVQGLVAQGRTVTETLEIARDVARKLIESQANLNLPEVADQFDYPLIVG